MIAAIGTAFSKFGSWVINTKAGRWFIAAVIFIFCWIAYGERRENQGKKKQELKQKERDLDLRERADDGAKQIIEEEKTDADEAIEAGDLAVRDEPAEPDRMSDEEYWLTFGRSRPPGSSGERGEG